MTNNTKSMTPNQLLEDYDYAVIRFGYDNKPLVADLFVLESSAIECALGMNTCMDDPDREYSVVHIEKGVEYGGTLEVMTDTSNATKALQMICGYIESECEKLRDRHTGESYALMTDFDHYRYEMDREAYFTMSSIYALISGATLTEFGGMMPSFPIPDYDH